MKTAISMPDHIFRSAEHLAARLGVSRSELYSKAVAALVNKYGESLITAQLNEIYGDGSEESALDGEVAALQQHTLTLRVR